MSGVGAWGWMPDGEQQVRERGFLWQACKVIRMRWGLCLWILTSLTGAVFAQEARPRVGCKPVSLKTGETGCWILAKQPLGALDGAVYWTIDRFTTKESALREKGERGTVVEALGKVWVLTVGEKTSAGSDAAGTRVAQIGPLPIETGRSYTAQFMEATLEPGMVSETHLHSGLEAFYTDSGQTCLETPNGMQVGKPGVNVVVPEGVPMELTATGTETRRGLILILHDAAKPPTTLVHDWTSKGLCEAAH